METLGMKPSTKPQTADERDGEVAHDFSMPTLEEEHEDRVGGATEHDEEMEVFNKVGVATTEDDEVLYDEEGDMNKEGVVKMCPDELGAGLRRRNRHD